jgi:hypothetical protein
MSNLVLDRGCEALKAIMDAVPDLAFNVYTGKNNEDKEGPCLILDADGEGDEDPPFTGNFWVTYSVEYRNSAIPDEEVTGEDSATQKTTDQESWTLICNTLIVDDLPAQMSAAVADFTVQGLAGFGAPTRSQQDAYWSDKFTFRALCCASTL